MLNMSSPHQAPNMFTVPFTVIQPTSDYGATPLLRQVGGGCYSLGKDVPPNSVGEDLDIF
jgi:hypothetical protein